MIIIIITHLQLNKKMAYLNGCASSVGGPFCSFALKIRRNNGLLVIWVGLSSKMDSGARQNNLKIIPKRYHDPFFLGVA